MASKKDSIREAIFASKNFKTTQVDILGQTVDVRQPSLADVRKLSKVADEDKNAIVELLIDYTYEPGTNVKVFDKADKEALENLPMGDWVQKFQSAWVSLAGIDTDTAAKN